jgi:predicted Zn-dependent protease with MMP-like domain
MGANPGKDSDFNCNRRVHDMDRERFERLVTKAVQDLPGEFVAKLDNVDVVVQDFPTIGQLRSSRVGHRYSLLGLYEGVPQTRRGRHYGLVPPDKITIFQKPIEATCRDDGEITTEIQRVVRHEIAHHFGISDARLQQIEGRGR